MRRRDVGDEYDIDISKLDKLEKMITRVDADIHRIHVDKDKVNVVETLKKTHDIYQLILGEIQYQLTEMKLEKHGSLIQKIFLGENTLLNGLLKMKTNLEFHPQQMIDTLEEMGARARRRNSSSTVEKAKQNEQFMQIAVQNIAEQKQAKAKAMLKPAAVYQSGVTKLEEKGLVTKVLIDRATDTGIDREDAKNLNNVMKKTEELDGIKKEIDESAKEMENFLKEKRLINFDNERSKAETSLKLMLKDLTLKKRKAEQAEREGEDLLLSNTAREAQRKAKQEANAAMIFGSASNVPHGGANKPVVKVTSIEIQTDPDMIIAEEMMKAEIKVKTVKLNELEKKLKESQKEADISKETVKKLNEKISELNYAQKKIEDDIKKEKDKEKKETKVGMSEKDKERFKGLVEDNYKMKYKIKDLLDQIRALDKENKNALDKFRQFVMNSNLTDDQKKQLLGKAEEMFTLDLNNRLNLRDYESMTKIDNEMLKDPLIRNIIGDPVAMVKKIKQAEKDKVLMRQQPGYSADFDPGLLEEGEKIVVRKTKKKVKVLNENGEWVEQEVEVEEECVVDKSGKLLRAREKQKEGATMDPNMQSFVNSHGGLAIGGAKFKLPQKPMIPTSQNGQVVKENEWFVDSKGNKTKMTKNTQGQEVFEVQEEYIDENGNKKIRTKKIMGAKDKDGNDVLVEEFVDSKTGKKVTVQKKVFRDASGAEVNEEITTDANGKKLIKRIKLTKDENGNDVIEEENIDELGRKVIVRKKKIIDANGNESWVTETINHDGTKKIITEKLNAKEEKIIQEETVDKQGNKSIVQKRIMIGKDGKFAVEETTVDSNGVKVVKNIRQSVDKAGNIVNVEESIDSQGNKISKRTREITDKDGNKVLIEESVDANGNKITKTIKKLPGDQGFIEETIDEFGNKITKKIKKKKDKDGNEITEEEIIDASGAKIVITTKRNKDGSIEEERYNPATGERVLVKRKIDPSGKETVEEIHTDRTGKQSVTRKVIQNDANGNRVVEESFVDSKTGKKVVITKIVKKDENGNDIVEEKETVDGGPSKTARKRVVKDSDGREVIEEETVDSKGKKVKIRTKVYRDSDGNEIIEEERIDENGNKVIVKRKQDKAGKQVIEEIKLDKDGNKISVSQKIVEKDGSVLETVIDSKGKVTQIKRKLNYEDKEVQVGNTTSVISGVIGSGNSFGSASTLANPPSVRDLEQILINLGCSKTDATTIAAQIMEFIQKGTPFNIGDHPVGDSGLYAKIKGKHDENLNSLKEQRKKDLEDLRKNREEERIKKMNEIKYMKEQKSGPTKEDEDESQLLVIDDKMTEKEQVEAMFSQIQSKGGPAMAELIRNIKNQSGLAGDEEVKLEHFQDYFNKYKQVHSKCGEGCPHLKRFYSKLGFIQSKFQRKFLKMKDTKINAFKSSAQLDSKSKVEKLPKIGSAQDLLNNDGSSRSLYMSPFVQKNTGSNRDHEPSIFKTNSTRKISTEGHFRQSDEDVDQYEDLLNNNLETKYSRNSRRGSIEDRLMKQ